MGGTADDGAGRIPGEALDERRTAATGPTIGSGASNSKGAPGETRAARRWSCAGQLAGGTAQASVSTTDWPPLGGARGRQTPAQQGGGNPDPADMSHGPGPLVGSGPGPEPRAGAADLYGRAEVDPGTRLKDPPGEPACPEQHKPDAEARALEASLVSHHASDLFDVICRALHVFAAGQTSSGAQAPRDAPGSAGAQLSGDGGPSPSRGASSSGAASSGVDPNQRARAPVPTQPSRSPRVDDEPQPTRDGLGRAPRGAGPMGDICDPSRLQLECRQSGHEPRDDAEERNSESVRPFDKEVRNIETWGGGLAGHPMQRRAAAGNFNR